jgi:hypothetical protein
MMSVNHQYLGTAGFLIAITKIIKNHINQVCIALNGLKKGILNQTVIMYPYTFVNIICPYQTIELEKQKTRSFFSYLRTFSSKVVIYKNYYLSFTH